MKIRPIRTPEDLSAARELLATLLKDNKSGARSDDIEVLATLIEQFEKERIAINAPSPVAAIKFRMDEMGLSARQLEPFIGSRARVSEVLSEKRSLSIDMIRSLHEGLGIPYESLISSRIDRQAMASEMPGPTIERFNSYGLDLDVTDVPLFARASARQRLPQALHRKTRTQRAASKTDPRALLLWQAAVLKRAEARVLSTDFSAARLTPKFMRHLATLSSRPNGPALAISEINNIGIRVVAMPPLQGTFLDGAAMLDDRQQPIVALTLRHDRTDGFWFTTIHELSHIHLHFDELLNDAQPFIDDMEIHSEDEFEKEADDLARISLIPDSVINQVRWSEQSTNDDLLTASARARVHISVVAGRWQRDFQNYRRFARLIERDKLRSLLL
jgi:HTH-type transcriptional regulator/antitoxin HigA